MSRFTKILRIIYPLVVWIGTLAIPLTVIVIVMLITSTPQERRGDDFWFIPSILAFASLACSIPAFLLFTIAYIICQVTKLKTIKTKLVLLGVNLLNIYGTIFVIIDELDGDKANFFSIEMLGVSLFLLVPSVFLILIIRIPRKKTNLSS